MEDFNNLVSLLSGAVDPARNKIIESEIIKFQEKFDINYRGDKESEAPEATLLHVACKSRNVAMVAILLERGADPTILDQNGDNAYMLAIAHNDSSVMQQLLSLYDKDRSGLYQTKNLYSH